MPRPAWDDKNIPSVYCVNLVIDKELCLTFNTGEDGGPSVPMALGFSPGRIICEPMSTVGPMGFRV